MKHVATGHLDSAFLWPKTPTSTGGMGGLAVVLGGTLGMAGSSSGDGGEPQGGGGAGERCSHNRGGRGRKRKKKKRRRRIRRRKRKRRTKMKTKTKREEEEDEATSFPQVAAKSQSFPPCPTCGSPSTFKTPIFLLILQSQTQQGLLPNGN
ncbi:hypothetical protein llap_9838 [Limosa lapponica baueri]|uniref:Uncharacterized protein n=1 Tax=Limosa lapponica baueri TaxID=1758121 RepID=A0A2I0U1G5_LIMLA|nr:hypothetical protein llap_9838 [Limosa lapponica baueri]